MFEEAELRAAWDHVLANDAEDGVLGASVRRFAGEVEHELGRLAVELAAGTYRPAPLTAVRIPKESGGWRELHVPVARDRVVERAVASRVTPLIEPLFSPSSFAYRRGIGVSDAVERVVELREDGFAWGARTDVDDCFPTIDRQRMMRLVSVVVSGTATIELIGRLIERPVRVGRELVRLRRGLAQGGALSPVLSNLYLYELDVGLARAGVPHVRFADDMVLFARDRDGALHGLDQARRLSARGGQRVGDDKSKVVSFKDGFAFLGEEFNERYPPASPNAKRLEPARRSLYVGHQGSGVRVDRGRIVVHRGDEELLSVPSGHVARIVLFGSVGLSAGARSWALANGADVVLVSRRGSYLGSLVSASGPDAGLRRRQYRLTEDADWTCAMGRAAAFGKLSNLRALLLRYIEPETADEVAPAAEQIDLYRGQLERATSAAEIMGVEGIASRRYWEAIGALVPPELGFDGRERRPPDDVMNAALGYGYAILCGEAVAAIAATGLDPAAGFLHADAPNRMSLALDLMEEFRPVIVDTVVLELVRRGAITLESGRADERRAGGVLLTEKARKLLVGRIEDRLLRVFRHVPSDQRTSHRRAIQLQAAQVAAAVRSGEPVYEPVLWR